MQPSFITWGKSIALISLLCGCGAIFVSAGAGVIGIDKAPGISTTRWVIAILGLLMLVVGATLTTPISRHYVRHWGKLSNVLDQPVRVSEVLTVAALMGPFFLLYQLSLSLGIETYEVNRHWHFGADNNKPALVNLWDAWEAKKHPLFVLVSAPLYRVGDVIYTLLIGGKLAENLAVTFPVAIVGAANVYLCFRVFLQNHANVLIALLFSLLYGLSASTWIFSSFPETYALTAFCTNLFVFALLVWRDENGSSPIVSVTNALASFAAPQQLFLAIIPCLSSLRAGGWSWQVVRRVVWYLLVLTICFVVPFLVFLRVSGGPWGAPSPTGYLAEWGSLMNLISVNWYLLIALNFFVFSTVGPAVEPALYADPSLAVLSRLSLSWIMVGAFYVLLSCACLWKVRKSPATFTSLIPATLTLLAFYVLFFVFFNPREAFIFTLPILLPWLLIIHSGFVNWTGRKAYPVLLTLLICVALNNLWLIIFLNTAARADL